MNKKLITMLVTFCFMLLLAPVSVMAATPTNAPIVIDVGGANVENENYKITDTGINIVQRAEFHTFDCRMHFGIVGHDD